MARPRKPTRLYFDKKRKTWTILDGKIIKRTGCAEEDRAGADQALEDYLTARFTPQRRQSDPAQLSVAEVLTAYATEHAPNVAASDRIGYAIAALAPFWSDKLLSDINGKTCNEYAISRSGSGVAGSTVRRELVVLSAAIGHWHKWHGPLTALPVVTKPPNASSRIRWLTRTEAARLLAAALGFYETSFCDVGSRKVVRCWKRSPHAINRHVARFILVGLYTGTRRGAILSLRWVDNLNAGYIDVERSVLHRRGEMEAQTKKRRPPARIGRRLTAHARRWKRLDMAERARLKHDAAEGRYTNVVHYNAGLPIASVKTAWANAVELAYLDDAVVPHVLRHTRATWLLQNGISLWEAASILGMSVVVLEKNYGHHHPDWQRAAADV